VPSSRAILGEDDHDPPLPGLQTELFAPYAGEVGGMARPVQVASKSSLPLGQVEHDLDDVDAVVNEVVLPVVDISVALPPDITFP
jgi:hypothetical protein